MNPSTIPPRTVLSPLVVDIWFTQLDATDADLLSEDEITRASRFVRGWDRVRFVAGRTWLRRVLASYLDVSPAEIRFEYGERGRPFLTSGALDFNLAHSANHAILAVASSGPVGADIEIVRIGAFELESARLVLSPNELRAIEMSEDGHRDFLRAWVRKEAYAKASGTGLNESLKSITLTPAQDVDLEVRVSDVTCPNTIVAAVAAPETHRLRILSPFVEAPA